MDSPPPLSLVGPAANNPDYETVSEIRRRLGVAFNHPSTTAEQREKIILAEAWLGHGGDNGRLFIPAILREVEKMYRPANGGSRKRTLRKKRHAKRHAKRTAKHRAKRTKKQTSRK
jgi:hypothetical protein